MQTQAVAEYPATTKVYGLDFSIGYFNDPTLPKNTIGTDTETHTLFIANPGTKREIEHALRQVKDCFKGSIDDSIAHH